MPNIERLKKYNKIHMVGIGGVSMSGIAEILKKWINDYQLPKTYNDLCEDILFLMNALKFIFSILILYF